MSKPYLSKKSVRGLLALSLLTASATPLSAQAKNEMYGNVYPIVEPDALKEIQSKAKQVDPKKLLEKREDWTAFKGSPLPVARKDVKRTYIPWYINEMEIKGPNGKLLYPRGFRFNPLQYTKLPQRIVVFKKGQEAIVKPHLKDSDMLIMDTGDVIEAGNDFGRHIFILDERTKDRLNIKRVPSFIWQEKHHFVIQELGVDNAKTD